LKNVAQTHTNVVLHTTSINLYSVFVEKCLNLHCFTLCDFRNI